jgi:hypothetical protein
MGAIGRKIFTMAVGLLLAAGVPYIASTAHADPAAGGGCDCPCGEKDGCGHGKGGGAGDPHGKREGMHGKDGGHMHGGHPHGGQMEKGGAMKEGMARHMEEMRAAIANLRALEAKMDSLKSKDDAAAFRAASLEHSKLLTDLQASHLRHMEGMMGGK